MKAIILAAGFGTRLQRDLYLAGPEYSHLKGLPKPLLPIADKPLVEYLVDELNSIKQIEQTYIITNKLYYNDFQNWADSYGFNQENIIQNQATSNETRLGAIADLQFVIQNKQIDDDIIIIAGDTLFPNTVKLSEIVDFFYQRETCVVTNYQVPDNEVHRRGILELDQNQKIINMLEKPQPTETNSRNACPPLYLYTKQIIPLIKEFLEEKANEPLMIRDAPGHLLSWIYSKTPVHVKKISGRFDVGNLEQYIQVNNLFLSANKS